ncbi:Yip1 domain-containing protein [Cavenderia fasciculata]|uniref:Protein YIPF n=1 Tax=Cavenderia fasciculata TaxID=261658 RepID=F4PZT7_CACFS|nr:Yip1 domain-containing protein [Cavenderia fasciculata]EGG18851.1 Yip1 domain-containing protein [Cavenderia fasciculata]|eukprot:XP_004357313.1 Yip1 domain-containing protein [Cavenderia fasciculata]
MSFNNNNHNDGNPFYSDVPQQSPPPNQQQQQPPQHSPQQPTYNQPQAIFTNTNVNFDDYSSQVPKQQPSYQPNLQFQSFAPQTSGGGSSSNNNSINNNNTQNKIGGGNHVPESDFSEHASLNNNTDQSGGSAQDKKYSFWQVPYYRFLFNVDTVEVGQRLLRSMMPIKFSFFNLIKENPDLYGPVWVSTSLVFIIAISANLNEYFQTDHTLWKADIQKVVYSAIAIYGYSFVVPFILWAVFKWMKLGLRLIDMACIYGYSLFIFVPISVLCVIPIGIVQWVIVGFGALVSGAFLVTNIFTPLKEDFTKRGIIICAIIGALHLGLALFLRLYFFANYTNDLVGSSSDAGSSSAAPTPTPTQTPTLAPNTTTTA